MNEHLLLDLATDLGYELAVSGAETYRVEDSVRHVLTAYNLEPEVAAIPGYVIVSILGSTGEPMTRMRRIGFHGNDLDAVERLNALSRRLCQEKPQPEEALGLLRQTVSSVPHYGFSMQLLGHFLSSAAFGLLFGCGFADCFFAGLCGILICLLNGFTNRLKANPIFCTLAASFVMSLAAYGLNVAGIVGNSDTVIIGGMMILVPGLVFTNALRDMIYGDISSGINKCVQVLLIASAMALGSAGARNITSQLWGLPATTPEVAHSQGILCLAALVGCLGFSILFNIRGPGTLLCALGGIGAYTVYAMAIQAGFSTVSAVFYGTALSAVYAEIMARLRKFPTICYLVVGIIPLIPGAGLYYTMCWAVDGSMSQFVDQGLRTAGTAGVMAASIILVSSLVRIYTDHRRDCAKG